MSTQCWKRGRLMSYENKPHSSASRKAQDGSEPGQSDVLSLNPEELVCLCLAHSSSKSPAQSKKTSATSSNCALFSTSDTMLFGEPTPIVNVMSVISMMTFRLLTKPISLQFGSSTSSSEKTRTLSGYCPTAGCCCRVGVQAP